MRSIKLRWRLLALIAVFALVAAACGGDDTTETTPAEPVATTQPPDEPTPTTQPPDEPTPTTQPPEEPMTGGSVSLYISEPPFIDPQLVQDSEGFEVARLLFDGLTLYSPEGGAVIPGVAESWEANADKTVWTFNLRSDATFSDGSPVTAQDFVYGWSRAADPDLASRVYYHGSIAGIVGWDEVHDGEASGTVGDDVVEGIVALDDSTLEVTLNASNSLLPKILAHPVFSPVKQSVVESMGDEWAEMPIGNGPYQMSEPWDHDVAIRVERNDNYYGTAGLPDDVEFRIYSTQDAAFLDVQAGNLDIMFGVPDEQVEGARSEFGDRFIETPTGSFTYIGLPQAVEIYQNADLRRALLMAIDREAITDRILVGRVPANGFVPPVANGAVEDACPFCVFDPVQAKELYDASGGLPGDQVTISFNSGAGHEEWVEAVANDWSANLGITANFEGFEWAAYLDFLFGEEGAQGPFRLGWLWDYPSAYNFLGPLYACDSGDNLTGFCNEDLDEQLNAAITANTEEEGIPFLEEAQRIVGDQIPVIPIVFGLARGVHTDEVSNVVYTDFGFTLLENVVVER